MKIPEDRYVKVGSVNTRYWMEGKGEPVILLHGVTNSVEDWLLNITELATKYLVYAVDLIGHGKTDKPLSFSYHVQDMAHFIRAFMDATEIKQAHVIGHSLGGWIAFYLAIDFPSYVNKLVIVDGAGLAKANPIALRLLSVPGLGELLGAMVLGVNFEKYLEMQRKTWTDAEVVTDELIKLKYEATRWAEIKKPILKFFRTTGNIFGIKDQEYLPMIQGLSSIKNPVLAIWGRQDNLTPVAHTQVIKAQVPHAQIEIFDGCGHDAMVEKPAEFNNLVLEFFEKK